MENLEKVSKKNKVVDLKLRGKSIPEIAEIVDSSIEEVTRIIGDAQAEGAEIFTRHGEQLLAFDLILLKKLTQAYLEDAIDNLNHKSARTVMQALTLKAKIIQDTYKKVKLKDDPAQREMAYTFGVNSEEYEWAAELAAESVSTIDERRELSDIYAKVELLNQQGGGLTEKEIEKIIQGDINENEIFTDND